jgi:CO/xanthine dehydrogenase Mo-binding subunit
MTTTAPQQAVGASPPRPDGLAKVTGEALYTDDMVLVGMWHGAAVRCPHARARVVSIDPSPALEADPEAVIMTAADLPGPNVVHLIKDDWPVLAADEVNYAYEAVAIVAAPTRERALAAADRVAVTYEPLPAVLSIDDALRGDPRTGGQPNVLHEITIDHGDVGAGFEEAEVVVEGTYETGHQEHIYIEPNGMIGLHHGEAGVEVVGSLQCPYYVHKALSRLWGLEGEAVRVRQAETGGGFGGKEDYPNMVAAHATLLAWKAGHPVKIIHDRHEDIVASTKRHPSRCTHRTGVRRDGTLVAQEIEVILDGGAYTTLSPVVLSRAVLHAAGAYRCPNVRIHGRVLATNTATNGAFRGFGAPQSQFAAERQMDRIARALGIDPLTIRERNAYREGDVTPTGQVLASSVSAMTCLEEAERRTGFRARWAAYEAARRARAEAGDEGDRPHRGIGLSLTWHGSGFTGDGERRLQAKAGVRLARGGRVEVLAASTDFGQGTSTVFAQIVADAVGVGVEHVEHITPDTKEVPDSGPTVASRTVMIVGGVLTRAGATLKQRVLAHAAAARSMAPDAIRLEDGRLRGPDGEDLCSFAEAGDALLAAEGACVVIEQHTPVAGHSFDEATYRGTAYPAYGWLCDVVEVEVDPDTLATRPTKLTMVCDVGKAIHPVLCKGQVEGGSLQAIAWGYMEEVKLQEGRYLNDRLQTYIIPTTLDVPDMDTVLIENPVPSSPTGAKGVGELPMDGGAPAIVQAIENATGIACRAIPATPERLLAAERAGRTVAPQAGGAGGEGAAS